LCGHWLARRLLIARLFPDHFRANGRPAWPHELCLEALLVGGVVLGISTMGVMATFAMLFIPPWVAFRLARGWMRALLVSVLLGAIAYLAGLLLTTPLRLAPFRLGRPA
jgi:zinc/manganese transport system permease protein